MITTNSDSITITLDNTPINNITSIIVADVTYTEFPVTVELVQGLYEIEYKSTTEYYKQCYLVDYTYACDIVGKIDCIDENIPYLYFLLKSANNCNGCDCEKTKRIFNTIEEQLNKDCNCNECL